MATIGGLAFTAVFLIVFMVSERYPREAPQGGDSTSTSSSSTRQTAEEVTPEALGLTKPYRKLVAIRSPHNLSCWKRPWRKPTRKPPTWS